MKRPAPSSLAKSAILARQRQRDTAAERAVGAALRALGVQYRKNVRALPGAPDFANRARRWAIFVNGCFWHAHTGCPRATTPKANRPFWRAKFARNRARDAAAIKLLRRAGFRVAIIWECQIGVAGEHLSKVLESRRPDVG